MVPPLWGFGSSLEAPLASQIQWASDLLPQPLKHFLPAPVSQSGSPYLVPSLSQKHLKFYQAQHLQYRHSNCHRKIQFSASSVQFSSVAQLCLTLCDPMNCSTSGLPVHYQLQEFTQTHVHWVGDAIQPTHPLSSPSPPAFNLSQHQGLFQWVSYLHQVAKVLEFRLQHQSFQWMFGTDFL